MTAAEAFSAMTMSIVSGKVDHDHAGPTPGRKVHHDPRSSAFPVAGLSISSLKSVHW
jgi:hypothetical protein